MTETTDERVASHYTSGELLHRFVAGLRRAGADPDALTHADLVGRDEFHVGEAEATRHLIGPLGILPEAEVLDVGCGVGGVARLVAAEAGCRVTGLDLTPEFVETARRLTVMVGMDDRVSFVHGSGTAMPLEDDAFDLALLVHVGMNVEDKAALFAEVARVLRPGGRFAVYDVMEGERPAPLTFPMPWAGSPDVSFVAAPENYVAAAEAAGLTLIERHDRGDFGRDYMQAMVARATASSGPPPLGPALFMGPSAGERLRNVVASLMDRCLGLWELIFEARA